MKFLEFSCVFGDYVLCTVENTVGVVIGVCFVRMSVCSVWKVI